MPTPTPIIERLKSLGNRASRTMDGVSAIALGIGASYGIYEAFISKDTFGPGKLDTGDSIVNTIANVYYTMSSDTPPLVESLTPASIISSNVKQYFGAMHRASGGLSTAAIAAGALMGGTVVGGVSAYFNKRAKIRAGAIGFMLGAAFGGYESFKGMGKLSSSISSLFYQMNGMTRGPLEDKRRIGTGAGYRSWAKTPGGRMPVGHLGATGDLVLSMHKTRHQSIY